VFGVRISGIMTKGGFVYDILNEVVRMMDDDYDLWDIWIELELLENRRRNDRFRNIQ
jgi:hypothetical protein